LLAAGTRLAGDHTQAIKLYRESLALNRRLGDTRMVGVELHNIGHVEVHRGNAEAAERAFAECAEMRNREDPYDNAMTHLNAAAPRDAEGVITMATDPAAWQGITEGPDGVVAGVGGSATAIEMSTVGPDAVARLASVLPDGVGLLDAPVLGSRAEAESGSLYV